jgi:hypothetical protein
VGSGDGTLTLDQLAAESETTVDVAEFEKLLSSF